MAAPHVSSEIIEAKKDLDTRPRVSVECVPEQGHVCPAEDDINQLFQAIDTKASVRRDTLQKHATKRPVRADDLQASRIGILEPVNLKQTLRGLCLSQASEIATMKRRLLRTRSASSAVSNVGSVEKPHRQVVAEAHDSGESSNEGKGNFSELSPPGKIVPNHSAEVPASVHVSRTESLNQDVHSSAVCPGSTPMKAKTTRAPSPDKIVPLSSEAGADLPNGVLEHEGKLKPMQPKHGMCSVKKNLEGDGVFPTKDVLENSVQQTKLQSNKLHPKPYRSSSTNDSKMNKSLSNCPSLGATTFRNKNFIKRKTKAESKAASSDSGLSKGNSSNGLLSNAGRLFSSVKEYACKDENKGSNRTSSTFSGSKAGIGVCSSVFDSRANKVDGSKIGDGGAVSIVKAYGRSKMREKGEISHSSKSRGGLCNSSKSNSGDSSLSGSSFCGNRPHMSKELRWEVVHCIQKQHGSLNLRHFRLLRRLGSGDIGTVYLAELVSTNSLFALKFMDNEFLSRRNKLARAQTEREILQMLDHPFLPTLYVHFTTDKLSCLVTEYCPGGDLHVLRQRQPCRCFSEKSARFYVAEVLLALEYLHMLGVVYRDLKPENVLVREDGHIMLSDFDLSLRCIVNPTVLRSSSPNVNPPKKVSSPCLESSCIEPFVLQPSCQVSCFTPRLLTAASKTRKGKPDQAASLIPLPQLVAEPTEARSNSFVGTHEYLAPEIIKGEGHGSAVDWWTFGVFLYELLYGKTPFKGSNIEETLANVVSQPLKFPISPIVSFHARNLIKGLLIKEPGNRLGCVKGAAEIKQHPFFEGLNWALIRCAHPPQRPRASDNGLGDHSSSVSQKYQSNKSLEYSSGHIGFELF